MNMFRVSHISVSRRQQWNSTHHSFFGTVQPRGKQPCFRGLFLGVIAGILLIIGIMLTWIGELYNTFLNSFGNISSLDFLSSSTLAEFFWLIVFSHLKAVKNPWILKLQLIRFLKYKFYLIYPLLSIMNLIQVWPFYWYSL